MLLFSPGCESCWSDTTGLCTVVVAGACCVCCTFLALGVVADAGRLPGSDGPCDTGLWPGPGGVANGVDRTDGAVADVNLPGDTPGKTAVRFPAVIPVRVVAAAAAVGAFPGLAINVIGTKVV